jgi:succinoglycan biosynthesis protein ExoA
LTPTVSIIVPCYNEHATIRKLLEAILSQTFPREKLEVIISDGFSTDDTRDVIATFQAQNPDLKVRVVDNTAGSIPAALNQAIRAAQGEVIVRLDAHSMPYPDYVARCKRALEEGRGLNVGGIWEVQPGGQTWIARSIAVAASHPLGVGDAQYRLTPQAGEVDTVPFGSFHRSLIDKIGPFDETLLSNEDYEFNARLRRSGGKVWLDPAIRSVYFARRTFSALARQYWRYGLWKWRMLQRYPATLRWRQALPPLFVLSLCGLLFLSLWFRQAAWILAAEVGIYFAVMALAGVRAAWQRRQWFLIVGLPLAIFIMHMSWGGGFLWSIIASPRTVKNG